jgi:hypothetical protein
MTLTNASPAQVQLSFEGRARGKQAPWIAGDDATEALPGETLATAALLSVPDGSAELVITAMVSGIPGAGGNDEVTFHGPIG